ncbi:MAG: glutamyl-tRNA reductase [Methanomassiliicoccales archaeon]|nr:glutamyl-tRNA reductase [Methanomassiliicoccales archaeon]NYT15581.1 glutamyl-tRNA reductase [Methanomassiliicoccales archaeon]
MIVSAHITHKSADMSCLELIGQVGTETLLHELSQVEAISECVVLRTCNRVEMYAVTADRTATREGMERLISRYIPFDNLSNLVQFHARRNSIIHLLRVASGLESLIVGEDQIQAQVKTSFETAEELGYCGPVLSQVFRKAISVGKKVRAETLLNKGTVSVGSAAVELAESILGTLQGRNILVVGAGETATLIARHLIGKGPNAIFVSNRTYERAVELAFHLGGRAIRFNGLFDFLPGMDILLVATSSPHMLLDRERVEQALSRRVSGTELLIIDISFPRNVDPEVGSLDGVRLHDIDGLRGVAKENMIRRNLEIQKAELIVTQELGYLEKRLDEMRASELISALHLKYNNIKEREVRRALNRINGNCDHQKILDEFASSLTKRFLADPTESLKSASREEREEMMELARFLFKIKEEDNVS